MPSGLLIADSGPLIALSRLDLLEQLSRVFHRVWIPPMVLAEVTRKPHLVDAQNLAVAVAQNLIEVIEPSTEERSRVAASRLDPGESEAIALALQHHATLLIDERKGRRLVRTLALDVIGTLGVLVVLRKRGAINRLTPYLDTLKASGYYVDDRLLADTLHRFDES